MLLPVEVNTLLQKKEYKENLISFFNFGYSKVVFILLIQVIVVYLIFFNIYFWKPSLKIVFLGTF